MKTYKLLIEMAKQQANYFCLLDPDNLSGEEAREYACKSEENGADGILVGGSLMYNDCFEDNLKIIKGAVKKIPVLIFPGLFNFVSRYADALLLLSVVSSRNPQMLIGEQVRAAPLIKKYGVEAIGTGYILIDGGNNSSVQYMSHSMPIPHAKDDIAAVHALAAQYMGMRIIYMDAGSGAVNPISNSMISQVKSDINIPLFVGGGIRKPDIAAQKAAAGADFVVTGNVLEEGFDTRLIREFAQAIHHSRRI
ncbi:MAG: geranylgeranylglyceryl/heptaprenylglyceryl phosphate synthase [Candidatus Cloacimonetes bacterium]|nr:geranylgeranylglyceryl/heptaprenylglyceryl phosphate synthase [Candidatus Cloacimonadota bacterium]